MRKRIALLVATVVTVTSVIFFAAGDCSGSGNSGDLNCLNGHKYGEWVIEKEATCKENGEKYRVCTRCGESRETLTIEKLTTHTEVIDEKIEPTCTDFGFEAGSHCKVCGITLSGRKTLMPLSHNFENGECTRCGIKDSTVAEYVNFGSFPQTKVTDGEIISALNDSAGDLPENGNNRGWTDYGFYIESDNSTSFSWYIDLSYGNEKYRGVYFTSYRPYDWTEESLLGCSTQKSNNYYLSTVYWFKYESIKWRVLAKENGKALLLSEFALEVKQFDDGAGNNNYYDSTIRAWLNGDFYDVAFDENQKTKIFTTEVDNGASTTFQKNNSFACENTFDKVFLLSVKDILNENYGFSKTAEANDLKMRAKTPTDYAKSLGCSSGISSFNWGNCCWLLRSPWDDGGAWDTFTTIVNWNGNVDGWFNEYTDTGIVPAIWIDISET